MAPLVPWIRPCQTVSYNDTSRLGLCVRIMPRIAHIAQAINTIYNSEKTGNSVVLYTTITMHINLQPKRLKALITAYRLKLLT